MRASDEAPRACMRAMHACQVRASDEAPRAVQVTYYLTEDAVREAFATIAARAPEHSILGFDYYAKSALTGGGKGGGRAGSSSVGIEGREFVASLGEPMRFGCNHILPIAYEAGFGAIRTHTFDELALAYTADYERARLFRFQSVAVAGRATSDVYGHGDVLSAPC
jgi:O-methyltransferase involved in polyketide biosynthesis